MSEEPLTVDRHPGGLDDARVYVQIINGGITPRPSLHVERNDEQRQLHVIDADIGEVLTIPYWRVESFNLNAVHPYVRAAVDTMADSPEKALILETIKTYGLRVDDEPISDHVNVVLRVNDSDIVVAHIHRGFLVTGWPTDETGRYVQ